jgi:hypothetical protein
VVGTYYGIYDYVLGVASTASEDPTDHWIPIPELLVTDGDVIVLFLSSNDIGFLNKTTDPWYSAQTLLQDNASIPCYTHDDAVRALGCTQRLQFCNPTFLATPAARL